MFELYKRSRSSNSLDRRRFDLRAEQTLEDRRGGGDGGNSKVRWANRAISYLNRNQVVGDIVACGVGHGFSVAEIATALQRHSDSDRNLHLYDKYWSCPSCGQSEVRRRLGTSQYPSDHIHYYQGIFEDTLSQDAPDRIALLVLNVRHWSAAGYAIQLLFPRLTHNGVLLVESDHAAIADYFRLRGIYFPLQLHCQRARIGVHHIHTD